MEPATLIPDADAIPAAWPWFKALLIPCFAVHLLFMNALLGSAVIGWVQSLRPRASEPETLRRIGKHLTFTMAFTINFGVAALLFMQVLYGHLFYTSSILMAVWWLSSLALVLTGYAAAYWIDLRCDGPAGGRSLIWTLMVAVLLLVGFVFVNNITMMQDPASWPRYLEAPGGTLLHLEDPTLIPRYLHFVIASVAVGGLVLAVVNRHRSPERAAEFMRWFAAATALQFIIGGWFFIMLPSGVRLSLMGADTQATALFAAALAAVLVSLVFGIKQRIWPSAGATAMTVLTMVLVRDKVRSVYLAPFFSVRDLTAQPQLSPLLVFGLFLILGVVAVSYMLRLYLKTRQVS